MSDPGPKPDLYWLPIDKLDVDPAYQRTLDTKASQKLIQKIADGFRWISFQAILATPVGQGDKKRWLIIDGQHRVAAARLRTIENVPAIVVAEASQSEQAAAFVGANKDRVPVSAQALFHARLVAGDEECRDVAQICAVAGIQLYRHNMAAKQFKPGWTAAIPAMLTARRKYGAAVAAEAISAVAECFGTIPAGLRSPFFLAAAKFMADGGSPATLRTGLRKLGIAGLDRIAAGLAALP
jgi:hypothetical protein